MHAKNITHVSTSISGADEALKWNNDSRSQPSASCWAATCSTPPELKRVAQVRQNRSLREKVTGAWEETGSGCRGLLQKGSLADAIQSCFCLVNLALGSFHKELGLTLVSPHALKISSETQDEGGHRWLSRWHSSFWVRAEQTQQHDAGGHCCWTRHNEIRNTDNPTLLLYKTIRSAILVRLQTEIYILQTKVPLAVLLQIIFLIMFSLKIYIAMLNHSCISVWRWLQLCTEWGNSRMLFVELLGPLKCERSYTKFKFYSINHPKKLTEKSEFVIILMMIRSLSRKQGTIAFHLKITFILKSFESFMAKEWYKNYY